MSAVWFGPSEGPPPSLPDLVDALHTPPWQPLLAAVRGRRPERRRPAEVTRLPVLEPAAEEAA